MSKLGFVLNVYFIEQLLEAFFNDFERPFVAFDVFKIMFLYCFILYMKERALQVFSSRPTISSGLFRAILKRKLLKKKYPIETSFMA